MSAAKLKSASVDDLQVGAGFSKAQKLFTGLQNHLRSCDACCAYVYRGEGNLCAESKAIISAEIQQAERS